MSARGHWSDVITGVVPDDLLVLEMMRWLPGLIRVPGPLDQVTARAACAAMSQDALDREDGRIDETRVLTKNWSLCVGGTSIRSGDWQRWWYSNGR